MSRPPSLKTFLIVLTSFWMNSHANAVEPLLITAEQLAHPQALKEYAKDYPAVQITGWLKDPSLLSNLGYFTHLNSISLSMTSVTSIDALPLFPSLTILDLTLTNPNSLKHLKNYKALSALILSGVYFFHFEDLKELSGLTFLRLDGTRISDLSVLSHLPLTFLNLASTDVSDLSPLFSMKTLTHVDLFWASNVKPDQVTLLREALPNCTVSGT